MISNVENDPKIAIMNMLEGAYMLASLDEVSDARLCEASELAGRVCTTIEHSGPHGTRTYIAMYEGAARIRNVVRARLDNRGKHRDAVADFTRRERELAASLRTVEEVKS